MSKKYRIGDYEFNTYEEYLAGQEDARKIDFITKEVDITDADVAVRLYTLIRNKEIVFRTQVGLSFSWYLTDVLAQNSKGKARTGRTGRQREKAWRGRALLYTGCGALSGLLWHGFMAGAPGKPGI